MPCSYRRHTRLKADAQQVYDEYARRLHETGWEASLPHRRQWLDLVERLKAAVRRDPETAYLALADLELPARACANPEEGVLTIGKLRRLAAGRFEVEDVTETCEEVSFHLGGTVYRIDFGGPVRRRRDEFLSVCNEALASTGEPRRFACLPARGASRPLVFINPACIEKAVDRGLIPAAPKNGPSER